MFQPTFAVLSLKSLCSKINNYVKIADTLQVHCSFNAMLNYFEIWEFKYSSQD